MSDEKPHESQPLEPPENNAAQPVPPPTGQARWQMPKPVFKKTSGYLPQGYEKLVEFEAPSSQPAASGAATQRAETISEPPPAPAAPVGEQPDILEDFNAEVVETNAAAPKRSNPAVRILIGVVVFLILVGFVAGFLYLIYVLFLSGEVPAGV